MTAMQTNPLSQRPACPRHRHSQPLARNVQGPADQRHRQIQSISRSFHADLQDFFYNDYSREEFTDRRRKCCNASGSCFDNDTMRAMLTAARTRLSHQRRQWIRARSSSSTTRKRGSGDQGAEFFGRSSSPRCSPQRSNARLAAAIKSRRCNFYIDECQTVIARETKRSRPF